MTKNEKLDKPGTVERSAGVGDGESTFRPHWRRKRWWALALVLLAVLIPTVAVFSWFVLLPTRVGTEQAMAFINSQLAQTSNLSISIERIRTVWDGIELKNVRLQVHSDSTEFAMLEAPSINLRISALDLIRGDAQIYSIHLMEPSLSLVFDENGGAVIPALIPDSTNSRSAESDSLGITLKDGIRIHLNNASFDVIRPDETIPWWSQGNLVVEAHAGPSGIEVQVIEGDGFLPQLGLVVLHLTGTGTAIRDQIHIQGLQVETDAGSIAVEGDLSGNVLDLQLEANGWPWEFVAEILEQPSFDVPGSVDLKAEVGGTLEAPQVIARLDGSFREEQFTADFVGRLTDPAVEIVDATVLWGETRVEGSGVFHFDGRWSLNAFLSALDLSQLERLAPQLNLPASHLGGPVQIISEEGILEIVHEKLEGILAGIPVDSLRGEWVVGAGNVGWSTIGRVAGGILDIEGIWDGTILSIIAMADGIDATRFFRLHPELEQFTEGEGRVRLSLIGPPDDLALEASLRLDDVAWRGVRADQLVATATGRWGGGRDSVAIIVSGSRLRAGPVRMDTLASALLWRPDHVVLSRFESSRADTSISLALNARKNGDTWTGQVWPLTLQAGKADLLAQTPVYLELGREGFVFPDVQLSGTAGELSASGWIHDGESTVKIQTQNLDLATVLGSLPGSRLSGLLDLNAGIHLGREELRIDLDGIARDLSYRDASVDSLHATVRIRSQGESVRIDELILETPQGRLISQAVAARSHETADSSRASGWGWLWDPRVWQGTLEASDFDISLLSDLIPEDLELRGLFTGAITLEGASGSRIGETEGEITAFALDDYRFDRVTWKAKYGGKRIQLETLALTIEDQTILIEGHVPLEFAWGKKLEEWLPEEKMDLELHLPEGFLSYLPLYLPQIAAADGKLRSDVRLVGYPQYPKLRGEIEITDGAVRINQREEIYRNVSAKIELAGEFILIRDLTATQENDGHIRGRGQLAIFGERSGEYRLEIWAENALAKASGEYAVSFDGNLVIRNGPKIEGQLIATPSIRGVINVRSGVILYDFADPGNVVYLTGPKQAPMYVYEIEVNADKQVYWRTPSANIELEVDLTLSQSLSDLKIWGSITSIRGTYFFLENKFDVEQGVLTFDQAESLDPKVDARSVTSVTRALGESQYEKEEVYIELTGRVLEPEMQLYSSSGLSQKDILALLTYGRFGIGTNEALSRGDQAILVGVTGTQYLVRQLSREFPELSPLLSDIEVGTTVGKSGTQEHVYTTVGVSRYFTPELRLRYSQVVGAGNSGRTLDELNLWDVSAEYRIGRIFFLTGEMVERRTASGLGTGAAEHEVQYNLDVRARYEY